MMAEGGMNYPGGCEKSLMSLLKSHFIFFVIQAFLKIKPPKIGIFIRNLSSQFSPIKIFFLFLRNLFY